ncbi:M50 family metallopeptidase [Micromonospora sp. M12]
MPLHLNGSMVLLAVLIAVLYGEFARRQLDLPQLSGYLIGFGFVVSLLGSVLLHELGHALTARRYGIGVRGITLELLGGYTEMDRDAPSPRVDLLVSLAGPAVSAVLGVLAVAATVALPEGPWPTSSPSSSRSATSSWRCSTACPGCRSTVAGRCAPRWGLTHDRHLGTEVAGWAGRVVAVGTAVLVLLLTLGEYLAPLAVPLMLLVAVTLWRGAGQSIRAARVSRRFPLIDLSRLARPAWPVTTGTPLAEAQRRRAEGGQPGSPAGHRLHRPPGGARRPGGRRRGARRAPTVAVGGRGGPVTGHISHVAGRVGRRAGDGGRTDPPGRAVRGDVRRRCRRHSAHRGPGTGPRTNRKMTP